MSIETEITRIKSNIADTYTKAEAKGATLPTVQNSENLASTIESIPQSSSGWQPEPDWFDIDKILEEDTEDYPAKMILLFDNSFDELNIYRCNASKIKTSDGTEYTGSDTYFSHSWDTSKDKVCGLGYKTRYVIYYYSNSGRIVINDIVNMNKGILYAIMKNFKLFFYSNGGFYDNKTIEAVKFINMKFNSGDGFNSSSLRKLIWDNTVHPILNMQNSYLYSSDLSEFDLSKATSIPYYFQGLYSLSKVAKTDTSKITNFNGAFRYNPYLKCIERIDFNSATSVHEIFNQCYSLSTIKEILNIKISGLNFSSCPLNRDTVLRIKNACCDYSADTENVHNIIIGPANIAKLTDEEMAEWLQLGWTVS